MTSHLVGFDEIWKFHHGTLQAARGDFTAPSERGSSFHPLEPPVRIIPTLKPGLAYAAIVFAIGFALGTVRVFLVVPRIGVRWAELLEAPLMIFTSFLGAHFITRHFGPLSRAQCIVVGVSALVFMLLAEATFVLAQGLSIPEYIASRDPVSGPVYLLSLGVFAAMPLLVSGRSNHSFNADGANGPRS